MFTRTFCNQHCRWEANSVDHSGPQTVFQIALLSNNENEQTAAAHNNMDGSHDQIQKGLYFMTPFK